MKNALLKGSALAALLAASPAFAANYVIDTKGAHASVNFRIQHLGYSWLQGRFNDFEGQFSYDAENPSDAKIEVTVDTASIDSNHAERDKHLRGDDFLDVEEYPTAHFVSTGFDVEEGSNGTLKGDLTLHGVTQPVEIEVTKIGEGEDPWGGYRAGFTGTTEIKLKDFGIDYNLGPASETLYLQLDVEGIRQ